jgi:hypothetical protein
MGAAQTRRKGRGKPTPIAKAKNGGLSVFSPVTGEKLATFPIISRRTFAYGAGYGALIGAVAFPTYGEHGRLDVAMCRAQSLCVIGVGVFKGVQYGARAVHALLVGGYACYADGSRKRRNTP